MFYTYLWLRENGTPYYIGKGTGNRAFGGGKHSTRKPRSPHLIILQHWESEEKAFEMEKWWIAFYGRKDLGTGCLRNYTDGGEGGAGAIRSEETRSKMSTAKTGLKGHPISAETRRKLSSEETRLKMSTSAKARGISEETRKKMRNRTCSKETRIKLSEAGKGRKISEEGKRKRSEALMGHSVSEETRLKISATKRAQAAHA